MKKREKNDRRFAIDWALKRNVRGEGEGESPHYTVIKERASSLRITRERLIKTPTRLENALKKRKY